MPEARAQLRAAPSSEPIHAGRPVNAFIEWEGAEPLEGLLVEVPVGWSVRSASAVRDGAMTLDPLGVTAQGGGAYLVEPEQPLRGPHYLVLGLAVGQEYGYRTVALTPLVVEEGEAHPRADARVEWGRVVSEAPPVLQNRAFHLADEAVPIALRRRALPSLDPRDPLTLEFWIRTLGLGEVVLSTWDGEETRPYPLEVMVDARGRIVFYRGRPGLHEALASPTPIADGRWHHVAVAHDPAAGWTRLYVDGLAADSLRSTEAAGSFNTMSLVVGGRPVRPGEERLRAFSGYLDELRLWPRALGVADLRAAMRTELEQAPRGVFRLGFDRPIPEDWLVAVPAVSVRVRSDLSFAYPVEALEATTQHGIVTLTWQTKDRRSTEFLVERSTDGQTFAPVGTVRVDEEVGASADGALRFAYTDLPPDAQVLYYRVRQVSATGPDRVSGTLKLGLGPGEQAAAAAILGNSPNPFAHATDVTFELASAQRVLLTVWDVSGGRVATLVDEALPAGRHTRRFEADGLPSGVYFVRLQAPSGSAAHKMTLTR